MASTMAARNAIKRFHIKSKQCPRPHQFSSSRSTTPLASSSILLDHDSRQRASSWSAALLTAVAVASSSAFFAAGPTTTMALAEEVQDEGTDEENGDDPTEILNWSGTHSVELPPGAYHEPETTDELASLVSRAHREGRHVRPVGSALSPNGLAFDSRGMVGLSHLDKVMEIDREGMTVTVQAGARVSDVLDALRPHGLTLPNLASIAEQQVGGFVSVGAHGTGATIPPCDEFVTALTLATPSDHGVVRMTEESQGPLFRMARLGLGGLGILSEVTLRVVPAHRLVERTVVLTRSEARESLPTLLKRHKHVRYMWIPYEDAVVVVSNDPEEDLPLLGPGTEVDDGKGGKKKIVTAEDLRPKHTRDEQLAPLREFLRKQLENKQDAAIDEETVNGMGFGDLRDVILASGNMLDPDHVKRCNRAEREFWEKAQGIEIAPSDQKLQFDCGGQQWVYEVCFPTGTYGVPGSNSTDFMEELLREIEKSGVAAPSPIEQRWSKGSTSPLSPASTGSPERASYETQNALFSWVGVIMYLPSEDADPTGYRREFIAQSFKDQYCPLVRRVGEKYGLMCHWAKLEADPGVAEGVRARFGPETIAAFNAARDMYDPKRLLSCSLLDEIFGPSSSDE